MFAWELLMALEVNVKQKQDHTYSGPYAYLQGISRGWQLNRTNIKIFKFYFLVWTGS